MNTALAGMPEVIGQIWSIDDGGDDSTRFDKVVGIHVLTKGSSAVVQLDVRDFRKKEPNLILEIELHELVAAVSLATLNAAKNK